MKRKAKQEIEQEVVEKPEEEEQMEDVLENGDVDEEGQDVEEEYEEMEVEEVEGKTENGNGNVNANSHVNGERSTFKVLGNQEMKNLETLKVTSSWVQNATTFSATIDSSTSQKLSKIDLPEHLTVPSAISTWFPVQFSVLPTLFSEISSPPALRPRDVAIAAPTGSGKTICYVLPVLAAVGSTPSNKLHAVILVPVQTLVSQIVDEFRR
uniref:ATP-dependent RNA helicase n=1 Tax=Caenorhabditis japonica TaxID=281687 RepID=A0A8R1EUZ9_CAEJA